MNGKIWQKQEVSEATQSDQENKIPKVVILNAVGSRNFHPRSESFSYCTEFASCLADGRGKLFWISSPGLRAALVMST